MKIFHNVHGWINNEIPEVGEKYLVAHGGKFVAGVLTGHGSHPEIYAIVDELAVKKAEERRWRDSELLRTDDLAKLPDYPRNGKTKESFLDYRQALADYPESADFPTGSRPTF